MFPEWGHDWPLWEAGVSHSASELDDLRLPSGLRREILDWYEEWAEKTLPFEGWEDERDERAWILLGEKLLERVRRAVWLFADVERRF